MTHMIINNKYRTITTYLIGRHVLGIQVSC